MNKLFLSRVKSFSKEEKGATMFEYAILVGVIALIAIGGAMAFGSKLTQCSKTRPMRSRRTGNN